MWKFTVEKEAENFFDKEVICKDFFFVSKRVSVVSLQKGDIPCHIKNHEISFSNNDWILLEHLLKYEFINNFFHILPLKQKIKKQTIKLPCFTLAVHVACCVRHICVLRA